MAVSARWRLRYRRFEVSGLKVVQSWLGYRMKKAGGQEILAARRYPTWNRLDNAVMSAEVSGKLLSVSNQRRQWRPELAKTLDKVVAGRCFTAAELPTPKPEERKAPDKVSTRGAAAIGGIPVKKMMTLKGKREIAQ